MEYKDFKWGKQADNLTLFVLVFYTCDLSIQLRMYICFIENNDYQWYFKYCHVSILTTLIPVQYFYSRHAPIIYHLGS